MLEPLVFTVSYPTGQTLHYRDRGTNNFTDTTNVDLLRDIVYFDGMATSDVFTFTITGLSPSQEYQVFGYAVDMFGSSTNNNKTVSWTTSGGTVQHTTDSANEDLASARFQMANMIADANGEATITAQYTAGGPSIILWNGFDIVALAGSDTTPPTLSSTNPVDEASDISASANLVATFDEDIAPGSGLVTIRNLTDATESNIDITDGTQITISGTTLTINPTANLLEGKDYAVRIAATAIEDSSGNAFAGIFDDTTWNFSTVAPTPPFTVWADSGTLPGTVTFQGDLNADGVQDGLAFLLGVGHPDDDATDALPTVSEDGSGGLVLSFDCLPVADRGGIALRVAYSDDLSAWTTTTGVVPDASGTDAGGIVSYVVDTVSVAPLHRITVMIDASAGPGDKLFGRLVGAE